MSIEETENGIYALQPNEKFENGEVVDNTEEYQQHELEYAKARKNALNVKIRDEFLNQPIEYKGILWDSDLDQKINLGYSIDKLSDDETISWFGADGISTLEATKEDLINILGLIVQKTTFVWQIRNPEIKTAINNAKNIAEVDAIDISYDLGGTDDLSE